jgi:DNA mismatch repair ATPase MutL
VAVTGLFRNVPVRKNYLNSGRRGAEELKRTDNIVKSLAVIHPGLRVTFCHNKCMLWQKSACTSLCQSLMQVFGHFISSKLEELALRETEASVLIFLMYIFSVLQVIFYSLG